MGSKIGVSVLVLLVAAPSFAAEEEGALVEKVAVRNRLFTTAGRFEIGANFGFSILTTLTEHYTFNAAIAYNFVETFAVELLGGASYTRHTTLASDVASQFLSSTSGNCVTPNPNDTRCAEDLTNLWEMVANGTLGLRWAPLYGKIGGLLQDVLAGNPIHFQFYLSLGGGVGYFKRESVVICNVQTGGECIDANGGTGYYAQSKVGPLVTAALGFRIYLPIIGNHHSIKAEVRDFSFIDEYLIGVSRIVAKNPNSPDGGGTVTSGITNMVQVHVGYSFMF